MTRRRQRARAVWRNLHLGLALAGGLLFAFLGVTGSMLVFHREIDTLLNPNLLQRQSGGRDLPVSAVVAMVHEEVGPILRVDVPEGPKGVYRMQVRHTLVQDDRVEVAVDPGSGQILGTRPWRGHLVAQLYDLHSTLLAGRRGKDIVGYTGLALLVSVASGLYLWWPRRGGWRRALRVKRHAPASRRIYDIHKSAGLPAAALLLVSAFSGVTMEFPQAARTVVETLLPSAPSEKCLESTAVGPEGDQELERAVAQARATVPEGRIRRILMPNGETDVYRVYLRRPEDVLKSGGLNVVTIDASTGELTHAKTTQDYGAADWLLAWQFPLHNGEAFGMLGRGAIFVLGFVPLTLYVTGLMIWWNKRQASEKRSGRN